MAEETNHVDAAVAAASDLLSGRLTPIRDLAQVSRERAELQAQMAELDRRYARSFTAAQNAGWSDDELKKLGYGEPVKRQGVRRTRKSADPSSPTASTGAELPEQRVEPTEVPADAAVEAAP